MTLLVVAGTAYRLTATQINAISKPPIKLNAALVNFPLNVGNWSGSDIQISETVLKVAGNDDYLVRKYVNSETGQSINLFISFSARPSTMRSHKPENCYPGGGWIHDGSSETNVKLDSGRTLTCLMHRFHKPLPQSANVIVLNYYILDGRLVTNEDEFSALRYRMVSHTRNAKRYVTQVQISSSMGNSVISATSEFSDLILKCFPGTNGAKW